MGFWAIVVGMDMYGALGGGRLHGRLHRPPGRRGLRRRLLLASLEPDGPQPALSWPRLPLGRKPRLDVHRPDTDTRVAADLAQEVDRILAKISRDGEASLTAKELAERRGRRAWNIAKGRASTEAGQMMPEASSQKSKRGRGWLVIAVAVPLLLVYGIYYINYVGPEWANRMHCAIGPRQIGLAFRNYAQAYRCFPPAYTTDRNSHQLHSWRTLILPYLCRGDTCKELRFDEPWNSPHNRNVLQKLRTRLGTTTASTPPLRKAKRVS